MNAKARDYNVELMRFVFMFLICMVHAVGYVPMRWCHPIVNVSFLGVVGFVLISGYFGVRFSFLKAMKIEGVGLGCAITVVVTAWMFGAVFTPLSVVWEIVHLFKSYWFIHAYVLMMVLASLLSPISSIRVYVPFFVLVYGWSFAMLIPGVQRFVPRTPGLVPYSGITLFAAYLIGRLYRTYDLDRRLTWRYILPLTLILLLVVSTCGPIKCLVGAFARYNSPFLVLAAVGVFWMLRRVHVPRAVCPVLVVLAPSVLSVYLLHCNEWGYRCLAEVERNLQGFHLPDIVLYVVMSLLVFCTALVLDVPRRIMVLVFRLLAGQVVRRLRG